MVTDDIDEQKDIEKRVRYYESAQVSLFAASRAAHAIGDDFLVYLVQMALAHLESMEVSKVVN
jgi:hypothetical protein